MHFIRKLEYVKDYQLLLTFEGEIFEPLKDINYFKTVSLDSEIDTIAWDNGADISPDFLYEIGEIVNKSVA